jgi:hypothetical protein
MYQKYDLCDNCVEALTKRGAKLTKVSQGLYQKAACANCGKPTWIHTYEIK